VKDGVPGSMKLGSIVGILYPGHDVIGIKQHHQVLSQIGKRIDNQLLFGEEQRAGLRDAKKRPYNRHIDVRQITGLSDLASFSKS
jgi:hypothetical protein